MIILSRKTYGCLGNPPFLETPKRLWICESYNFVDSRWFLQPQVCAAYCHAQFLDSAHVAELLAAARFSPFGGGGLPRRLVDVNLIPVGSHGTIVYPCVSMVYPHFAKIYDKMWINIRNTWIYAGYTVFFVLVDAHLTRATKGRRPSHGLPAPCCHWMLGRLPDLPG